MRKNTGNAEPASAKEKESPRMRNLKQTTRALCCALYCVALLAASHAPRAAAATIATTQQGMQQWRALNGKLVVIAASYRDTTSYKRSLTFYFEEKAGGEWLHVPVIESEADHTMTWFSVSNGESAVADAVVSTQGDATYLIVAEKKRRASSPLGINSLRPARTSPTVQPTCSSQPSITHTLAARE
jgi:hypothetical protein